MMFKIGFAVLLLSSLASQAFAFNPDPIRYEYIGQKKSDGNYIFYEVATAKADGLKGIVLMLQADPKNRTVRFYRNVVIDPKTMTLRGSRCDIYDYSGNALVSFALPNQPIHYSGGSLEDQMYWDLRNKGIIKPPPPPPPPPPPARVIQRWERSMSGGKEEVKDITKTHTIVSIPKKSNVIARI